MVLSLILSYSTPAFANLDMLDKPLDNDNPSNQDSLLDATDIQSDKNVVTYSGYQETWNSQENLIDQDRIDFFSVIMSQLEDRERNVIVFLPSDYQAGNSWYPVIYVLNAKSLFIRSGFSPEDRILNESLYQFYTKASDRDAIIVGIESDPIHIWDEYSPWVNQNMYLWMDPYDANQVEGGEGDSFLEFMAQTLKPLIDERYRTLTDRENTSIGGSGMGGLFSIYSGLTKPELYSTVLAMSPAVWFAESGGEWLSNNQLIGFIEQNGVPTDVKFYLDVTAEDRITDLVVRPAVTSSNGSQISFPQAYLGGTQALVDTMTGKGLPISSIVGGVESPTEWTKTLTESPGIISGAGSFLTYLPLVGKPAFPPSITSASTAIFTKSSASSFTITTVGYPVPTISISGSLPAGVSFMDNGNGTAVISGTPTVSGTYTLTITAQNGIAPNAIQTFTLIVIEGCPTSGSCLLTFSMSMSPYLNRTRNITVYLPPDYNAGAYYPVIYLSDAQHIFGYPIANIEDIVDWTMDEKLDSYYGDTGRGIIAVAVWYDADYPWSEYTRTANLNMDHWVSGASQLTRPEGGSMINFIRYKLKPNIDSRFHTLPDRSHTAIGGGSRCALLAIHAGLVASDTFSRVMSFSPAVWIAEGGPRVELPGLTTWYSDNGLQAWFDANQAPTNVKYFLYIGTNEVTGYASPYVKNSLGERIIIQYAYLSGALRVRYALYYDGVTVNYIENNGGEHYPRVWRAYIKTVMNWFGF